MKLLVFAKDQRFIHGVIGQVDKSFYKVILSDALSDLDVIRDIKRYSIDVCIFHTSAPQLSVRLFEKIIHTSILCIYISTKMEIGMMINLMQNPYFLMLDEKRSVFLDDYIKVAKNYLHHIKMLEKQLDASRQENQAVDLIQKAKRALMDLGHSEEDAHRYILKVSMDERISKKVAAKKILDEVKQ